MTFIATIGLVLALELAALGWSDSSLRRLLRPGKSELTDLLMTVILLLGWGNALYLIFTLGAFGLSQRLAEWMAPRLPHLHIGIWWAILGYAVAMDFSAYWVHRLFHTRWLWWFHKFHHDPDVITPFTAYRNNPASAFLEPIWRTIPLVVFSVSPTVSGVVVTLFTIEGILLHSRVPWTFGWLGRWIFNAPVNHVLHHSKKPEHYNRNFGGQLVVWDRLFGTWAAGATDYRIR